MPGPVSRRDNVRGGVSPELQQPVATSNSVPANLGWVQTGEPVPRPQPRVSQVDSVAALPRAPVRVSTVHAEGPSVFEGPKLTDKALQALNGIKMEDLGTTQISVPLPDGTTKSYTVRDMQYALGDGKVGMRLVPVEDNYPAGNKEMDDLIRKESGLQFGDSIYALIAYIHPEEHKATLKDAATQMLKPEMGNTHLGAYLGDGTATNAEENYHNKTWELEDEGRPYPANVQIISMKGVSQAELNRNLVVVDAVLNKGVVFPIDYKNDAFRTEDLNSTLMFYRDWLYQEPYLRDDPSWATYCSEHKTIVLNVGLNLPLNEEAYKEAYGAEEGAKLFAVFKEQFAKARGRPFDVSDETHFEPLWKKEGLTAEQIRPPTKKEFDAYQRARFDGSLANGHYQGYKPLPSGKGMAWRPEKMADLTKNFIETYAPFRQVGGFIGVASLMGFEEVITKRMGIGDDVYMRNALPIMNKMMVAEGMARAPNDPVALKQWVAQTTAGLYVAFGGNSADVSEPSKRQSALWELATQCMKGVDESLGQIVKAAALPNEQRNDFASGWLQGAISADIERARAVMVGDPKLPESFSPPAITHRAANGTVEKSQYVDIRVIATAFSYRHLVTADE